MNRFFILPAITLGLCSIASAAESATTLSIETGGCDFVGSRCFMRQTYGDTDAVDVSYDWIKPDGTVLGSAHNSSTNYGDLGAVLVAGIYRDGTLGQLTLKARDGYQLRLLDFDFVGYFNFAPTLPLKIMDLHGNELAEGTFSTGTGSTHSNLSVGSGFLDGVVIRWGPDAAVGGIDNIRYETTMLAAPVPEPATWAMLVAAFGLVGTAMRRRKTRIATAYA